ncbi:MAG TPA: hypothetical protein PKV17_08305, partial [Aquabacterium sp.]|nr:hypothetical protein [Aquabacterium sp.]
MNDRIRQLLSQITQLEDELRDALVQREQELFFTIDGKRIKFESAVRSRHRQLRIGLLRWLVSSRPQNWVS